MPLMQSNTIGMSKVDELLSLEISIPKWYFVSWVYNKSGEDMMYMDYCRLLYFIHYDV